MVVPSLCSTDMCTVTLQNLYLRARSCAANRSSCSHTAPPRSVPSSLLGPCRQEPPPGPRVVAILCMARRTSRCRIFRRCRRSSSMPRTTACAPPPTLPWRHPIFLQPAHTRGPPPALWPMPTRRPAQRLWLLDTTTINAGESTSQTRNNPVLWNWRSSKNAPAPLRMRAARHTDAWLPRR